MKQVNKNDADTCPYCNKVMGQTEGTSEMAHNGTATIWCAYCNKTYFYKEPSTVQIEYARQVGVINENLEIMKEAWKKLQESYNDQLKKDPRDLTGIGKDTDLGHIAQLTVELAEFLAEYTEFRKLNNKKDDKNEYSD